MKTVYQIFPKTKKCLNWINENVYTESWQWLGKSLVIEYRFIQDIYEGLTQNGFKLDKDFSIN